jgi:D,D-heptose 1,7-bisphosphate phosphatase
MSHAVFFDRDGTINVDPGYIGSANLVELLPGVPEGIIRLKEKGFKIIVISNQSGIARGYFTEKEVNEIHFRINEILNRMNTGIDAFYFCPFHPDFNSPEECECRKPSPKMIFEASRDFALDVHKSYMVGDKMTDVECGTNAGVKTVLINVTVPSEEISYLNQGSKIPTFIADSFAEACDFIIKDFTGGN